MLAETCLQLAQTHVYTAHRHTHSCPVSRNINVNHKSRTQWNLF